jgi:hypothetical protein
MQSRGHLLLALANQPVQEKGGLVVETVTDDDDGDSAILEHENVTSMFEDFDNPHKRIRRCRRGKN